MLRRMAVAALSTRTTAYMKLFEVYRMQYDSLAPSGTVHRRYRPVKHRVMRPAALAGFWPT